MREGFGLGAGSHVSEADFVGEGGDEGVVADLQKPGMSEYFRVGWASCLPCYASRGTLWASVRVGCLSTFDDPGRIPEPAGGTPTLPGTLRHA